MLATARFNRLTLQGFAPQGQDGTATQGGSLKKGCESAKTPTGFENTGRPFSKTGRSFFKTGRSFFKTGRSFSKTGRSFSKTGRSFSKTGRPFSKTGRPFSKTGRPFSKTGRPFSKTGRSFSKTGRSFSKTGRPFSKTGRLWIQAIGGFEPSPQVAGDSAQRGFFSDQPCKAQVGKLLGGLWGPVFGLLFFQRTPPSSPPPGIPNTHNTIWRFGHGSF